MIKKLIFLTAILNVLVFFTPACNTDQCKDIDCGLNGTCFEGTCICNDGWETDAQGACTIETIAKFTGQYSVSEDCSASMPSSYVVTIGRNNSGALNSIRITNFWGLFQNAVIATFDGNTITIARQEPDNDNYFVQGTGTYSEQGNTAIITMNYTVTEESGNGTVISTDNCSNTEYVKL